MLKKTITYEDFNGETVEESFFFHLSKAELVEMEMSYEGGLSTVLAEIVETNDPKRIIEEFKKIILSCYGQKSEDGRRFIKNQKLRDEFESSEAYSVLFMELVTNADAAAEFINGIVPKDLAEEAAKVIDTDKRILAPVPENDTKPRIVSKKEIHDMSALEFSQLSQKIASGEVKLAE